MENKKKRNRLHNWLQKPDTNVVKLRKEAIIGLYLMLNMKLTALPIITGALGTNLKTLQNFCKNSTPDEEFKPTIMAVSFDDRYQ